MYLPAHFAEDNPETLHTIMRQYPLAMLVVPQAGSATPDFSAHHLPLHLNTTNNLPQGVLQGHVARANPVWQESAGHNVLAVFRGPDHYITPNWYPSKKTQGKVVPTWNYVAVHAYGTLRVIEDKAWLRQLVTQLTTTHEQAAPQPWQVNDAPEDYLDKMLSAIVGFEIVIERMQGKFKLSQNRTAEDQQGVLHGLAQQDTLAAHAMHTLMKNN